MSARVSHAYACFGRDSQLCLVVTPTLLTSEVRQGGKTATTVGQMDGKFQRSEATTWTHRHGRLVDYMPGLNVFGPIKVSELRRVTNTGTGL